MTPQATGRDKREQMLDRVRTMTRGPIASRGRRQVYALGYLAAVGLAAVGPLAPRPAAALVTAAGVGLATALLVLLRRAIRWVADAPSEALDELFRRIQGECYTAAYQLVGALVVVCAAALLLVGGAPGSGGVPPQAAQAVAWLLLGVALGAPSVVTALTLPDAGPDDADDDAAGDGAAAAG